MNTKINQTEKYYSTSDLAIAACLSLFVLLEDVDNSDVKKTIFIFKQSNELKELLSKYWAGQLKVDPLAYFNELKRLKSIIYGSR